MRSTALGWGVHWWALRAGSPVPAISASHVQIKCGLAALAPDTMLCCPRHDGLHLSRTVRNKLSLLQIAFAHGILSLYISVFYFISTEKSLVQRPGTSFLPITFN